MAQLRKKKTQFDSLFDPQMHLALLARGERRFSLKAIQGALMITLYSAEQRFHIPHDLLIALMDIDSLITKWRCKYYLIQGPPCLPYIYQRLDMLTPITII